MARLTQEEVLNRFARAHGDEYDYSVSEYTGQHERIDIICKVHGKYITSAVNHWNGSRCPKCSGIISTKQSIISRLEKRFGDKYDWSTIDISENLLKMSIDCRKHGKFYINVGSMLHSPNPGCPICYGLSTRYTTKQMLDKFVKAHGDMYDYSKFEYVSIHEHVTIVCRKHGDFFVSPSNHWHNGSGCPSCWQNSASKPETRWVQALKDSTNWSIRQSVKIAGLSSVVDCVIEFTELYKPVILEYDGSYWHKGDISLAHDTKKTKILIEKGFNVVRLREISEHILEPIPNASLNVFVDSYPDSESIRNLIESIRKLS